MNLLEVKNICKTYGNGETAVKALKDVSFSVPKGEYVAIVGESGSGKSTLLNMIGALDTPTSGKVLIDGKDIFSMNDKKLTVFRRRNIGFIFQAFNLVPELTVEQNIIFPVLLESLYNKLVLCKKNKQLSQLYIHDSLTGLYNRMAYEKLALPLFQKYMQKKKHLGILFVDADHLKYINDNFDHDMGNLAIRSIASAIHKSCPVGSVCMRYGGDEFVCVIPDFDLPRMHQLEKTILHALEEISDVSRFPFPLEVSIGSVIADDAVFSLNDYINLADQKMYASKKARKAAREEAKN